MEETSGNDADSLIGGLPKTTVSLWVSSKIGDPSVFNFDKTFDKFEEQPDGDCLIYCKEEGKYKVNAFNTSGGSSELGRYNKKPSLEELSKVAKEFLLEQRRSRYPINIVTYPQAQKTIEALCDSVLTLAPHPHYDPKGKPNPFYKIRKIPRI